MKVSWLPEALDDIERLSRFLVQKDALAAERARLTISSGSDRLQELPEIGCPMGDGSGRRELITPSGAGAYILRYRIHHDTVVSIRVWHDREARD